MICFARRCELLIVLFIICSVFTAGGLPTSGATIAFHITVTEKQLPLLRRFYARVHHPSNLYLVDFAHPLDPHRYRKHLFGRNVHARTADPYVENGVSEVINILDGMAYFLDREDILGPNPSFDYFIHCTPEDYPTVTPQHMRALLSFTHTKHPPPNFFHFVHASQLSLLSSDVDRLHFDQSLSFNRSLTTARGLAVSAYYHPDRTRRAISLSRTSKHLVVNRDFVKLATDSMDAKRLLLTLGEASHVYEYYFGSLAVKAGDRIGKLVRSTSLRCVNSDALDKAVTHALPHYEPGPPTIPFLRLTKEPCLFTGPFASESALEASLRDEIDAELLIAPGTQGKPHGRGYEQSVATNLRRTVS